VSEQRSDRREEPDVHGAYRVDGRGSDRDRTPVAVQRLALAQPGGAAQQGRTDLRGAVVGAREMHAIDSSAFARVVTHESRHLNPSPSRLTSEVLAALSDVTRFHARLAH